MQKYYQLYGTKILNFKTKEIGLLICIWKNTFADGEVDYATCVDKQGKTKETQIILTMKICLMKLVITLLCKRLKVAKKKFKN